MANQERGETTVTIGDRSFTLVMDFQAIRAVEGELSTETRDAVYHEILRAANRGQYRAITGLFWASMQRHHPDMTMAKVDKLISELGGLDKLNTVLKQNVKASEPTKEEVKAAGGGKTKERPQEA